MGLLIPAYSPNIANSLTGKDCRLYAVSYLPWRFGAKVRGGPSGRRCFFWRMEIHHPVEIALEIPSQCEVPSLMQGQCAHVSISMGSTYIMVA
jgi:hypothetical protein